jgi:hypothetical protein
MRRRARPVLAALAAASTVPLAGCAAGPPLATTVSTIPNERLHIFWTRVRATRDGVLISGSVQRAGMNRIPLGGHLHIDVRVDGANAWVSKDTGWTGNLGSRVRRTGSFSTTVPVDAATVKEIRIAYRAGPDDI